MGRNQELNKTDKNKNRRQNDNVNIMRFVLYYSMLTVVGQSPHNLYIGVRRATYNECTGLHKNAYI